MKKIILLIGLTISTSLVSIAQKEKTYEKLYYKDVTVDNEKYSILVENAVSTAAETKFKLKITNKSSDYLIFKPEECKFIINEKETAPKEKWLVVKPFESESKVINFKGTELNKLKNYSFSVDGIYSVNANGTVAKGEDFYLPASKNDFTTGNFKCTLEKLSKDSDKTEAKFKVEYTGENVALIFPSKATVKMPDGKEYVSKYGSGMFSNKGASVLMKGQNETFTLSWDKMEGGRKMDMQLVEMIIMWHETFTESPAVKLNGCNVNIEFDLNLTEGKK